MADRRVDSIGKLDSRVTRLETAVELLSHDLTRRATLNVNEMRLRQVGHVSVVFDRAWSRESTVNESIGLVVRDELACQVIVRLELDELRVLDGFIEMVDRQLVVFRIPCANYKIIIALKQQGLGFS